MNSIQTILVGLVAFMHFYFMILEMFYWTKPKGQKAFGLTPEFAEETKVLGANQGLYNGFLSAGLVWSLIDSHYGYQIAIFFLSCVIIAGIYGAYSTKKIKLFYIQGIPAILAFIVTVIQ
jgi:putative membrane protein